MADFKLDKNIFPAEYSNTTIGSDTFGISSLKKQFRDLARPNRFKVIISPPSVFGTTFDYEFVTTMVKKVNMPSLTINEYVYERAGKKLHIPTHVDFSDLSITFFNDVDYRMKNLIYKWQRFAVSNWGDNVVSVPLLSLSGNIEVHQYDGSNNSTSAIIFTNCWPKVMQNTDFGHEMDSQTGEFTVDFVYTEQIIAVGKRGSK